MNRGGLFSLDKSSPDVLAGHKRPVHTIIPAFMQSGDVRIAFGIMGGWNQAQAHAQFVSNLVDFGMNIQGALDAPRFSKESFGGCDVNIESRIPDKVRAELARTSAFRRWKHLRSNARTQPVSVAAGMLKLITTKPRFLVPALRGTAP